MKNMDEMPMPGGWTMSMTWMIMPGQSWLSAGVSFLKMWMTMMIPMMTPCLLPMLAKKFSLLSLPVALGYFLVWALCGVIIFYAGTGLAVLEMNHPALSVTIPTAAAVIVAVAGAYQFTGWKERQLACCKRIITDTDKIPATPANALKHGLHLGYHCFRCCINLMVILLVVGLMDLWAMLIITVAMTWERLGANNKQIARGIGVCALITGLFLILKITLWKTPFSLNPNGS